MDGFLLNAQPIARSDIDPTRPGPIKAKWEFTRDELLRSPSVLAGLPYTEEQRMIVRGCTFIRKIGERLNSLQKDGPKITQLCISVSIIQLRRFYTIQSLQIFDARDVAAAILFLTSKSEECPWKIEMIVRAWFKIRYELDNKPNDPSEQVTITKEAYSKFVEYILWIENIVLQTTGFNLELLVPHPMVMKMASVYKPQDKKLSETVFWLVTDVMHLTNWTLIYRANRIAVVCFYMAITWKNAEFPQKLNGDIEWFKKWDDTITLQQIQEMMRDFLTIWKDTDKELNLSMSQFDHRITPVVLEPLNNSTRQPWHP